MQMQNYKKHENNNIIAMNTCGMCVSNFLMTMQVQPRE